MANDTPMTIVGNLTADPELKYTANGTPVCNLRIASTPSRFDRQSNEWVDEATIFQSCSVWGPKAEVAAGFLAKGMPVIATGTLRANVYEAKDGSGERRVLELKVNELGQALRPPRNGEAAPGSGGRRNAPAQAPQPGPAASANPWAGAQQQPAAASPWDGAGSGDAPF